MAILNMALLDCCVFLWESIAGIGICKLDSLSSIVCDTNLFLQSI